MNKIGIKILKALDYEAFERFQYLLDFDFDYDNFLESIEGKKIIELDIEDEDKEDRVEDMEALEELLKELDEAKIEYELFLFKEEWTREAFQNICS